MVERCRLNRPERMMIGEVVQASSVEKLDRCRWQLTSKCSSEKIPQLILASPCVLSFVAPSKMF